MLRYVHADTAARAAYGLDIGTSLSSLLAELVKLLPPDGRTMLRLGMTNPPYMLDQLEAVAAALSHPCVYSCIHIPVQSGSNAVLAAMNREYTVEEFCRCVDELRARVPGLGVHTDVICGFPGETDEDFAETMALVKRYHFPVVNISQFYARPGTPAARMKKTPSQVVKARSRALTALHESYAPHEALVGSTQRAWFTERAADGVNLAGKTKGGVQVIVPLMPGLMGCSALVCVKGASRWSVTAEVLEVFTHPGAVATHQQQALAPVVAAASQQSGCGDCEGAESACCQENGGGSCDCGAESSAPPPTVPATPVPVRESPLPPPPPTAVPLPPPPAVAHGTSARHAASLSQWGELSLWCGVLLGLTGVFAAGALQLWSARARVGTTSG